MPSPKSGTAGTLVSPATPRAALDADDAKPGEAAKLKAEQQASGTGKYGSTPLKAFRPAAVEIGSSPDATQSQQAGSNPDGQPQKPKSWIAIELVDENNQAVAGEAYSIVMPDGTVAEGTLDEKGRARIDGTDPGSCKITFPNLDKTAWKPK